jgi:hypothetical protein
MWELVGRLGRRLGIGKYCVARISAPTPVHLIGFRRDRREAIFLFALIFERPEARWRGPILVLAVTHFRVTLTGN